MPELPDVEGQKRYFARFASGRTVERITVHDRGVLHGTSPQGLGRALTGSTLGQPERRGKWLVVAAGDGRLVLHFGMTGELAWSSQPGEPERFDRVTFELDRGVLRYRAQRKLGGIWYVPRERLDEVTGELGPDADSIDAATFRRRLEERRGTVKNALMNQRVVAGLGNELSDEILWRVGIRPDTDVSVLRPDDLEKLHATMSDVLRDAVAHGRIPDGDGWLTGVRDAEDPRCPRCGSALAAERVAGRTSLRCPSCQDGHARDTAHRD